MPLKAKSETPAAAPAAAAPAAPAATTTPRAIPSEGVAANPKTKEVKGQVAMHAIITGYNVASRMAATLAASPDKVEEKLHALAASVAAKVEAYTFKGE